ncbi:hypothetical protein [Bacteroides thetaiotaomicron]|uniref:hypothetical protein n=1 Tax=Bacteroides thetaiotaomicron TaxID=818 RepID=UPI001EE04B9B|nr:hypothetical protein [Bacteroides thetaiotaomicron]
MLLILVFLSSRKNYRLRAENRKLHRALADESLRHEACEELINLAESTYHIKVRKNSDAK